MTDYSNPVSNPGHYGLTLIGDIEWTDEAYSFDTTVVLRNAEGKLCYIEDSGCSCPLPFENTGTDDLEWVTREELQAHLESRNAADRSGEIADLMLRVVS